jgi:hypothetical protein
MGRVWEQVNRWLAIKEDKIGTDGTTGRRGGRVGQEDFVGSRKESLAKLGKKKDTVVITGDRCIIWLRDHCMNLFRGGLLAGTNCGNVALLAAVFANNRLDFLATTRPGTSWGWTLGRGWSCLGRGWLVRTLGKHQGFLLLVDVVRGLLGVSTAFLAWRGCVDPAIHHREALVDGLGVKVIPETILVGKLGAEGTAALSVGPAEHQCGKELVSNRLVSRRQFILCWVVVLSVLMRGESIVVLGLPDWGWEVHVTEIRRQELWAYFKV